MSTLLLTGHWSDPAWRQALAEQRADEFERLRLLLRRRLRWMHHRSGGEPFEGTAPWGITEGQVSAALEGPDRAGELEFYRMDAEAAALGRSAAALEEQIRERAEVMAAAGTPFPLDRVTEAFGLDAAGREILLLALASELDAAFERAYAYLHDDVSRRYATPALAAALAREPVLVERALHPGGPLFRYALLHPGPFAEDMGAAVRPLRLDPRIAWYLQAVDHVGDAGPRLLPLASIPLPRELRAVATPVVEALRAPAAGGGVRPAVNLVGGSAGQGSALAAAIADGLGATVHRVETGSGRDDSASTARLDRESVLRGTLLLVHLPGDAGTAPATDLEWIEALRAPVLLWSAYPVRLRRPVVTLRVPPLGPGAMRGLWRGLLGEPDPPVDEALERIVHHFELDPEGVARAASAARSAARLRRGRLTPADLWEACRERGRRRLGGLAQRIEPCFRWDDIVVPADVRRQLEEIAAQVRHRALVYERWRFGDKLARGRGITALFSGPSGTGKTMAAEVLAAELELDLYRIDLAGVVSKYIGETEKNLRSIFEAAEESGAILFFDEADALFGKRTEVRDSHDRYANIEIDYLLQRMESYGGLAVLATNRRTSLDRAFLRRLRFLVDFPFPAADDRLRIWQRALPEAAPRSGLDFAALARMELAGGNIRSIALNAAFLAAADGKVLTMDHLMHAAAREYAKLDKSPTRAAFGDHLARGAT